jgi:hypothetical protein
LLALDFHHGSEVDEYQPAPGNLVGVDDATPLAEVGVVRSVRMMRWFMARIFA